VSTADQVALHAAERPEAVAFIDRGRTISYAQFSRDIGKFSAALRDLGLPPTRTVAVGCDDVYIHWLLLLAFEQLNVATASFDLTESPATNGELLAGVDLVLSDESLSLAGAVRQFRITQAWVQDALARDYEESEVRARRSPDDLVRILRSSGTTGRPKRLGVNRHMYELRAVRYGERYQFSENTRYLLTLSFAVGHIYGCATACLRSGGCIVAKPLTARDFGIFAECGITHVSLLPHFLKAILDGLPADFAKPADLTIGTSGSPLSDELSGRALRLLATEVIDIFGCNEIGGISSRRATLRDNFATVCPGVEVEAIDEGRQPVPTGEPGRLRIRSESMAEGYLDDPETTHRFFKDGWFYPSDIAILDGPRRIKIIGRADEMIFTINGKSATSDMEALIMKYTGDGDVGVCTLANRDGIEEVHVAIAGARLDPKELLARVMEAFQVFPVGKFHVVVLKAIPRNAAGKIQRARLKEILAAAVGYGCG
jgi:2,3-dihydroxybenzoate-AMP ligase